MHQPTQSRMGPVTARQVRPLRLGSIALICLNAISASAEIVNTKLNEPLEPGNRVESYRISTDGEWVVYQVKSSGDLYSVPIEGGPAVRLNGFLSSNKKVGVYYLITPDSRHVIYDAPQDIATTRELYIVPIEGPASAARKLNAPLIGLGSVDSFWISPNGERVVYQAGMSDHRHVLYSVPTDGPATAAIVLSDVLQGSTTTIQRFSISPDSSRVVFRARLIGANDSAIFSAPLEGPAESAVRLTTPFAGYQEYYRIGPNSDWVIYLAEQQVVDRLELFSVPIVGPATAAVKLNKPLVPDGKVDYVDISPDGETVVYTADTETQWFFHLYSVPIEGPASVGVALSPPGSTGHHAWNPEVAAGGNQVVYQAKVAKTGPAELYSVPINGPSTEAQKLSGELVFGGEVQSFEIAPSGDYVVYWADQDIDEVMELYSVPVAGPSDKAVQLNGFLGLAGDVKSFAISPDGRRVVYLADHAGLTGFNDDIFQLWMTSVDGSGEVIPFNGRLVEDGDVSRAFAFSPDNQRVVYIADQDTDGVDELYVSYDRPATAKTWGWYE